MQMSTDPQKNVAPKTPLNVKKKKTSRCFKRYFAKSFYDRLIILVCYMVGILFPNYSLLALSHGMTHIEQKRRQILCKICYHKSWDTVF